MKKLLTAFAVLTLVGSGCIGMKVETQTGAQVEEAPQMETVTVEEGTATSSISLEGDMIDATVEGDVKADAKVDTGDVKVDVKVQAEVKTHAVAIQGFAFSQKTLTLKKGDKVTFTNKDAVAHTATADNGKWDTGSLAKDESYTLDTAKLEAGTYTYFCKPHPNMKATLVITE